MANLKFLHSAKRRIVNVASKVPLRTAVTFGALGLSSYVDFTDPNTLIGLRIMNIGVVVTVVWLMVFCFIKIKRNPDGERKIQVLQSDLVAPNFSDDPEAEDPKVYISVVDYDSRQLRDKVQAMGTQVIITGALHAYAGLTLPMLIQSFTIPLDLLNNELFQLYVLGKDPKVHRHLKRPWKKEKGNKFMNFFRKTIKDGARFADAATLPTPSKGKSGGLVNAKKQAKKDKSKKK